MFEVVVTLFLVKGAISFALPQTYYDVDDQCEIAAQYVVRHIKKQFHGSTVCRTKLITSS